MHKLLIVFATFALIGPMGCFSVSAEPHGNNHDGSRGVHVVPLRTGPLGRPEIRPGQFNRGTRFTEEPNGWVDGDPCWDHVAPDQGPQYWVFICD